MLVIHRLSSLCVCVVCLPPSVFCRPSSLCLFRRASCHVPCPLHRVSSTVCLRRLPSVIYLPLRVSVACHPPCIFRCLSSLLYPLLCAFVMCRPLCVHRVCPSSAFGTSAVYRSLYVCNIPSFILVASPRPSSLSVFIVGVSAAYRYPGIYLVCLRRLSFVMRLRRLSSVLCRPLCRPSAVRLPLRVFFVVVVSPAVFILRCVFPVCSIVVKESAMKVAPCRAAASSASNPYLQRTCIFLP